MWDLPGPGLEPVPPALAGGFLTTAPPGKPGELLLLAELLSLGSPLGHPALLPSWLEQSRETSTDLLPMRGTGG